jgi:hypothetical protein
VLGQEGMHRAVSDEVPTERRCVEELPVGLGRTLHSSFDHAHIEIASTVGGLLSSFLGPVGQSSPVRL